MMWLIMLNLVNMADYFTIGGSAAVLSDILVLLFALFELHICFNELSLFRN